MIFALQLAFLSFTHSFNDFLEEESHLLSFIYENLKCIKSKDQEKEHKSKIQHKGKIYKTKKMKELN